MLEYEGVQITWLGHDGFKLKKDRVVYVDPYQLQSAAEPADVVCVTHEHFDHLSVDDLKKVVGPHTTVVTIAACAEAAKGLGPRAVRVVKPGDRIVVEGVTIEAVPAYNIIHMRAPCVPFHPKGDGNGYVVTFGDKRIYLAGDTENIPEMAQLKHIDIAFLPMNLPYTMTPEMAAEAARSFRPKVLYPYHFGTTDTAKLLELLKSDPEIEVRIRSLS